MHKDRQSEIERGMRLAADLPEVMPDQADERIRPIYEDIQRTLRVPFVNLIFRTLANYPDYFEPAWERLGLVLRTRAFEQAADEVRAQALLEPIPETSEVEWESLGELNRIRAFNDTIHYVLPKLLLIATAFDETSFGRTPEESGAGSAGSGSAEIPLGTAEGTTKVQMVNPRDTTGRIRDLFESVKERHGHPLVSSYYRALGNWPDFLEAVWSRIEPLVGSTAYEERKRALIDRARAGTRELSFAGTGAAGMDGKQRDEIRAILAAFRLKFIPEMSVDVALIKAMLDGTEAARSSRFSVADRTSPGR